MKEPLLNIVPSPLDKRDWKAEELYQEIDNTPGVLDLRSKLLPVRNQGQQGSCAAMAAACMKEWQEKIDHGIDEYMSPQYIYNSRSNQTSEGMYCRDLMKILHEKGSCLEKDYLYGTDDLITDELIAKAQKHKISGYAKVEDIETLKKASDTNGVCLIAVPVYNYGERMWKQGVGEAHKGGHAMAIAGYNHEGFIIRNSWGLNWDDDGYTIFPYSDWDLAYEFWTTIDEKTGTKIEPRRWYQRLWDKVTYLMYLIKDWNPFTK